MFECDVDSGELSPAGDEVQAARFWTFDEAARLPLASWLAGVLPRLYDSRNPWFEPASWRPPPSDRRE